jgi:hypothetical protein
MTPKEGTMFKRFRKRWLALGASIGVAAAATMLVVLPAAAKPGSGPRLDAKVVSTNPGPLSTAAGDVTWNFIYVENGNSPTNTNGSTNRATVPNSFAVSSIDAASIIDGVQYHPFDFTWTPPPDPTYRPYAGHWPSTVTCPEEGSCNVVGSPAVLPGEETAVLYIGWTHGADEPDGTYVFKYTIHGTVNGTPVDLHASSIPIVMTD